MKTTADALRWAIKVIENERVNAAFGVAMQKEFAEVKRILAVAEFVESDEAPNYTVDGGFTPEKAE